MLDLAQGTGYPGITWGGSIFSIAYAAMNTLRGDGFDASDFSIAYAAMNGCQRSMRPMRTFSIAYAAMNVRNGG